jgi:hypothetical protein
MRTHLKRLIFALFLASSLAPAAAFADWYFGAAVGKTNNEFLPTGASGDKDTSTSAKAFVGMGLSPQFALELGYMNLGKFVDFGSVPTTVKAQDLAFTLVGKVHVHPRVDFFGRWGLGYWDAKWTFVGGDNSKTGVGQVVGLGFDLRPTFLPDSFRIGFEWEQYQNVGEGASVPGNRLMGQNVDVMELRLVYHFDLAPGP